MWYTQTSKARKPRTPTLYAHDWCPSDSNINRTIITSYFPSTFAFTSPLINKSLFSFSPIIQNYHGALVLLPHSDEKKGMEKLKIYEMDWEIGGTLYLGCKRVRLQSPLWLWPSSKILKVVNGAARGGLPSCLSFHASHQLRYILWQLPHVWSASCSFGVIMYLARPHKGKAIMRCIQVFSWGDICRSIFLFVSLSHPSIPCRQLSISISYGQRRMWSFAVSCETVIVEYTLSVNSSHLNIMNRGFFLSSLWLNWNYLDLETPMYDAS